MATQTLTFSFTDTKGPAAMAGRPGDAWARALADHHRLIRVALAAHGREATQTWPGLPGLKVPRAARMAAVTRGGKVVLC